MPARNLAVLLCDYRTAIRLIAVFTQRPANRLFHTTIERSSAAKVAGTLGTHPDITVTFTGGAMFCFAGSRKPDTLLRTLVSFHFCLGHFSSLCVIGFAILFAAEGPTLYGRAELSLIACPVADRIADFKDSPRLSKGDLVPGCEKKRKKPAFYTQRLPYSTGSSPSSMVSSGESKGTGGSNGTFISFCK